jgi:hypothetical protein
MNKSSLIVSAVIALLGIFVGLYYAKNANDELAAYRAEHDELLADAAGVQQIEKKVSAEQNRLIENTDSLDWLMTLTENTATAYRQYLEKHANGLHADEAREILIVIASRKTERVVSIEEKKDSVELTEEPDTIS